MCTCKNKRQPNGNQNRRMLLPKVTARPRILPAQPQQDQAMMLQAAGPHFQHDAGGPDTLTEERRRIEKLHREAVRRSLGIA